MEQQVRVVRNNPDGTALVLHVRESACSGDCHKCAGCGAAQEKLLFEAENPIGAPVGALVRVEGRSGPVLKAALVLYTVPMLLFFAGYALGHVLFELGALTGCLAFGLGILLAVAYDRKIAKSQNIEYTIKGFSGKSP